MNRTQPRQYFAANQRAVANADAIEWEEMPSLTNRLVNHDHALFARGANDSRFQHSMGFESTWGETMPATLEPLAPMSSPFVERVAGLSTREVNEPDVFHHFFGPRAALV